MSGEHPVLCEDCGSPLAPDQRYCLSCGARTGERSAQLVAVLRRVGGRTQGVGAGHPATAAPILDTRVPTRRFGGGIPSPKVSAFLVLVFLGFGVLLGNVANSPVQATLAASARQRLKLVLPASAASTSSALPPATESEPPEAEAEPTPTAATKTKATAKAPLSSSEKGDAGTKGGSEAAAGIPAKTLPAIKHVFVIMLSDQPYAATFGPEASDHYLAHTLEKQGELLVRYDAVAHEELANELALLSGQGPTAETATNCPTYADITPATVGAAGQVLGNGCVYPHSTGTLAGQLAVKQLSWRGYVEGADEPGAAAGACGHPTFGQADPTSAPGVSGGPYATRANPFVYFHSILDTPACAANDVGIGRLTADLANLKRTPSFSYIAPSRCRDGNPTPCRPGAPAGVGPADAFLQRIVPEILASKAYKQDGLLVITTDEAPSSGESADSSACCGQPRFPNLPAATTGLSPRGGGTVGALLLSPFVKAGGVNQAPYNHFSLLRTIEDLFGLKHLGYASLSAVKPFEPAMFTASAKD